MCELLQALKAVKTFSLEAMRAWVRKYMFRHSLANILISRDIAMEARRPKLTVTKNTEKIVLIKYNIVYCIRQNMSE